MRVWRCAGKRPFGAPCRRRVTTRARWNTTWRCWTGALCDRCWRDALRYEPDRDAAIALDPNAPEWVVEHLVGSRDPMVLAGLASRGDALRPDIRRRLEATPLSVVHAALREPASMTPAWSLYRSTPRPGVVGASIVATALAVLAVTVMESAQPASSVEQQAAPASATLAPAPTTSPSSGAPPPVSSLVPLGTVAARLDVPAAATLPLPAIAPTTAATVIATSATSSTTTSAPTTAPVAAPPAAPAAQAVQATPVATSPQPTPAAVVPAAPVVRTVTFDVPFAGIVSYVGTYGVVDIVLRSPDGTIFHGGSSAEGSGPAGTWTADIQTSGAWAGEFTSRG